MFRNGSRILILVSTFIFLVGCGNKKSKNEAEEIQSTTGKSLTAVGNFYFVGMAAKNPAVYIFHSKNKSSRVFWSNEKESVIDLSYSSNRKQVFFLTAYGYGHKGALPYVYKVKLYLINLDSSKVKFVQNIGSGIQIFTAWETDNTFKVVLNSFDKKIANYINQEIFIFSEFGRKLVDNTKTYDITKEGYPKPPEPKENFISPEGKYLKVKKDSSGYLIFLCSKSKTVEKLIVRTDQNLNDAEWSPDEKFLSLSTLDLSPSNKTLKSKSPETSKLFVYSLAKNRIINAWNGSGLKNFFMKKNYLIFDDGFGSDSIIKIFNYKTNLQAFAIKIKDGCGLRNVPHLPNYILQK